jgi:hypothetical protein
MDKAEDRVDLPVIFDWGCKYICKTGRSSTPEPSRWYLLLGLAHFFQLFWVWLVHVLLREVFAELTIHSCPHSWEWRNGNSPYFVFVGLLVWSQSFGTLVCLTALSSSANSFHMHAFILCILSVFLLLIAASKLSWWLAETECAFALAVVILRHSYTTTCQNG